ncbi:DUF354 domain-containing protein [Halorubellus sp. JP-L1]|uniref:DUF354 domain-containing protein n=1 Tax=Halorubellus sp. JP-L1 TaxID=2715753 RepID=UPI00140ABC83|nr:DUF354 domain-containing protein [Halorubellus sp. JP-L1]NHN43188.1 DUF354 domain-containing protein [Halorubellus sp. JP-L1]
MARADRGTTTATDDATGEDVPMDGDAKTSGPPTGDGATGIDAETGDVAPSGSDATRTGGGKRILFNVGHPAQVHLFRNAIAELQARGHETLVASRHKEVTVDLLDAYDIEHVPMTEQADSFGGLMVEMLRNERRLLGLAREFEPDVIVSRLAPPPVHVSKLVGCKNVIVCDTLKGSTAMRRINHALTLRWVDRILVPDQFELDVDPLKRRHLAIQELAYLDPEHFEPDPSVLADHGIDPEEPYFFLRLAGWDAYHDAGQQGLSVEGIRELVAFLEDHGTVYLSAENGVPDDLAHLTLSTPPEDVHHVMYYADLYLGDSGTMSAEAAILGTPAIRTNSYVGNTGEMVYRTLGDYGLLHSIATEREAIETAKALAVDPPSADEIERRRERLFREQLDVTGTMVDEILAVAGAEVTDDA